MLLLASRSPPSGRSVYYMQWRHLWSGCLVLCDSPRNANSQFQRPLPPPPPLAPPPLPLQEMAQGAALESDDFPPRTLSLPLNPTLTLTITLASPRPSPTRTGTLFVGSRSLRSFRVGRLPHLPRGRDGRASLRHDFRRGEVPRPPRAACRAAG